MYTGKIEQTSSVKVSSPEMILSRFPRKVGLQEGSPMLMYAAK